MANLTHYHELSIPTVLFVYIYILKKIFLVSVFIYSHIYSLQRFLSYQFFKILIYIKLIIENQKYFIYMMRINVISILKTDQKSN